MAAILSFEKFNSWANSMELLLFLLPSTNVLDDLLGIFPDNDFVGAIVLLDSWDEETDVTGCGDNKKAGFVDTIGVVIWSEGASDIVVSVIVATLDVGYTKVDNDEAVTVEAETTGSALLVDKLLMSNSGSKFKIGVKWLAGTV